MFERLLLPRDRRFPIWLLLSGTLLLAGCPGFGDRRLSDFVDTTMPTWDDGIRQLMADRCVRCHQDPPQNDAPEGFRFDKYNRDEGGDGLLGAYEKTELILVRVVEEGSMPPDGALDDHGRALLDAWIRAGAPRSASDLRWTSLGVGSRLARVGSPVGEGDVPCAP